MKEIQEKYLNIVKKYNKDKDKKSLLDLVLYELEVCSVDNNLVDFNSLLRDSKNEHIIRLKYDIQEILKKDKTYSLNDLKNLGDLNWIAVNVLTNGYQSIENKFTNNYLFDISTKKILEIKNIINSIYKNSDPFVQAELSFDLIENIYSLQEFKLDTMKKHNCTLDFKEQEELILGDYVYLYNVYKNKIMERQ